MLRAEPRKAKHRRGGKELDEGDEKMRKKREEDRRVSVFGKEKCWSGNETKRAQVAAEKREKRQRRARPLFVRDHWKRFPRRQAAGGG